MKIAIFGAGLAGSRRGQQAGSNQIVGIYDPDAVRAADLASRLNTIAFNSESELLGSDADIVIVATPNNCLQPLAIRSIQAGKHVLIEKPAALSVSELLELENEAKRNSSAVKVGFNHRFHPAILKARDLVDKGILGQLMFLRVRYGHGGRLGMESEWRMNPFASGGGELLDQGVHILDLIYWFLGPLPLHSSLVTTSFWNASVDDNAVITLADGKTWATFHVSSTEWKNTFSLELYGRQGKVHINGLGGSYGKESITYYRMLPEMGVPECETTIFDEPERSWELDLANLVDHIETKTPLLGCLASARYALEQVRLAYRANGFTELPCSA